MAILKFERGQTYSFVLIKSDKKWKPYRGDFFLNHPLDGKIKTTFTGFTRTHVEKQVKKHKRKLLL